MEELKSPIRNILAKQSAAAQNEPDTNDEYTAYANGRVGRMAQPSLILRFADGSSRAFAYSYFYGAESDDPAMGFTIDFTQHKVRITGRQLQMLYRFVCSHKVAEISEIGRSQMFALSEDAPVVEKIDINSALPTRF